MKLVLVELYCGPLLTLIAPLTRTYKAKKRVSGNRVSDFRVSGRGGVWSGKNHKYFIKHKLDIEFQIFFFF